MSSKTTYFCWLRLRDSAWRLAIVPVVAGMDAVVDFICAAVLIALYSKNILIISNEQFQCLGFPDALVCSGSNYHFLQLLAETPLPSCLGLPVIECCGPYAWISMPYICAVPQHLFVAVHIHNADRYSRHASD
jgi:hypothetical protein